MTQISFTQKENYIKFCVCSVINLIAYVSAYFIIRYVSKYKTKSIKKRSCLQFCHLVTWHTLHFEVLNSKRSARLTSFPYFTMTTVKSLKTHLQIRAKIEITNPNAPFRCDLFFFLDLIGNFNTCALPFHTHANLHNFTSASWHSLQHCTLQSCEIAIFLCSFICIRLNLHAYE